MDNARADPSDVDAVFFGTVTAPELYRGCAKAFAIAANLNSAADDDEYRAAMREGLHTFDMLRERYGLT